MQRLGEAGNREILFGLWLAGKRGGGAAEAARMWYRPEGDRVDGIKVSSEALETCERLRVQGYDGPGIAAAVERVKRGGGR